MAFFEIVNKSESKPNILWIDQGKEFSNSPMQKWSHDNDTSMHFTFHEGKSVVAERFTRTLKVKAIEK